MVTALITVVGLMFCQEPKTFDGGVATIEPGPQYIVGDSTLCTRRTVLSPDGSKPLDLRRLTDQSVARPPIEARVVEGGIVETTLVPPQPIVGPTARACKTTYHVKTVELEFPKGKAELTKELRARLAMVMADSPVGLSLVGYVEEKAPSRNTEEMARVRLQAIRSQVERLAVSMPSMSLEARPLAARRLGQREGDLIVLTAVLAHPCGEGVLRLRAAPTMSR